MTSVECRVLQATIEEIPDRVRRTRKLPSAPDPHLSVRVRGHRLTAVLAQGRSGNLPILRATMTTEGRDVVVRGRIRWPFDVALAAMFRVFAVFFGSVAVAYTWSQRGVGPVHLVVVPRAVAFWMIGGRLLTTVRAARPCETAIISRQLCARLAVSDADGIAGAAPGRR